MTQPSTPEYLKDAFGMKKPKYSRSASNGEMGERVTGVFTTYY